MTTPLSDLAQKVVEARTRLEAARSEHMSARREETRCTNVKHGVEKELEKALAEFNAAAGEGLLERGVHTLPVRDR